MALILPGNVASATAATGYDVDNSCRFNDDDSAYMHKTVSYGGATSNQKWTISVWVKRSNSSAAHQIISTGTDSGNQTEIRFEAVGKFQYAENISSSETINVSTNALYRDPSAWYHLVCAVDTTQGTAANRVKLYVNGTLQTSLSTTNYPTEDAGTLINMGVNTGDGVHNIGRRQYNTDQYFDGYMAEFCWIDGLQLAATSFGEFDEDSPTIWKPIDVSGLTFGTNGFYLDFEASDNLGNDANGGTDLTEVNLAATDQATDTPTNNFATWNPLILSETVTFSEGNLSLVKGATQYRGSLTTMILAQGKWYAEIKCTTAGTATQIGFMRADTLIDSARSIYLASSNIYWTSGATTIQYTDSSAGQGNSTVTGGSNSVNTYTDDDIIMLALDMNNGLAWFGKNGTWENSGDPAAGSNAFNLNSDYTNGIGIYAALYSAAVIANFGSPAYAISSGNADADGYGNFEYAVPSGFFALCTKNLGAYGG